MNVLSVWDTVLKDMEKLHCKNSFTIGLTEYFQLYKQYGAGAKSTYCEDLMIIGMQIEAANQWREEISSKAAIWWRSATIVEYWCDRDKC